MKLPFFTLVRYCENDKATFVVNKNSTTPNPHSRNKKALVTLLLCNIFLLRITQISACFEGNPLDLDDEKEIVDGYSVASLSVADALEKQQEERYVPVADTPTCTFNPQRGFRPPDGHKKGLQFRNFIAYISPALAHSKQLPNSACTLNVWRTKGYQQTRSHYPYDICDANCVACGYHERFDIIPLVEHFFCCQQSVGTTIKHVLDVSKLEHHDGLEGRSGKGIITVCPFYFCKQKNLGKELWVPAAYDRQQYKENQLIVLQKTKREEDTERKAYLIKHSPQTKK